MPRQYKKVESRDEAFADKISTNIWYETPSSGNPYIPENQYCHGYNLSELIKNKSYSDIVFLLFLGELPNEMQKRLLDALMIMLINPGPRHPAARAAMNAGVGKTNKSNILPVSLLVLGGECSGGAEVEKAMWFIKKAFPNNPGQTAKSILSGMELSQSEEDVHVVPGFGSHYGSLDTFVISELEYLSTIDTELEYIAWSLSFSNAMMDQDVGCLISGLAAAAFLDLGFHPRYGAGLFQLFSAPGLLAHGLEYSSKPHTAFPFLDKEHYIIENEKKC